MSPPLRIVFAGTPEFAARHLQALLDSRHQVIAVYTKPDSLAGRGKKRQASEVKQLAVAHDIAVYQPKSLKKAPDQSILAELGADLMVVVAYGLILPPVVLAMPRYGCINVHGSILPRWRGAAPIQRAIWAGDQQTGVTIMQMDVGLDTGDIISIAQCPIDATDTSASIYYKLAELGPVALIDAIECFASGDVQRQKQDDQLANYAEKLSKEEALIDWQQPATTIARCVRAFNPWPVSYMTLIKGNQELNIKVWQAQPLAINSDQPPGTVIAASKAGIQVVCGEQQVLNITSLQVPGKKAMAAHELLNARANWFTIGSVLGSKPARG